MNEQNETVTIDLMDVVQALVKRLWIIVLAMVICGSAAFAYAYYVIPPTYQSSALFYVNGKARFSTDILDISSADLNASQQLVDTYMVILKTRKTLNEVIKKANLPYSYDDLNKMVSATSVDNTAVFRITVTDTDPVEAEKIANTIAEVLPDKIREIIDGSSARIVDYAIIPGDKAGPNVGKYTAIGLLVGFALACAVIILLMYFDYEIHSEEYLIKEYPEIPLLAVIPDLNSKRAHRNYSGKSGKYKSDYKYGSDYLYTKDESDETTKSGRVRDIGPSLSFASREAYKQLRTNIDFALTDVESRCKVVGISSTMRAEGKSTTAINLSYSLAQSGQHVLLVEGDMRIPSIAEKLNINADAGLSDEILSGEGSTKANIKKITFKSKTQDDGSFYLLNSGKIPPNPSEILGSAKMQKLVNDLKEKFDYIIVDLPPVIAVTDALVASRFLDGMILAVRQDHTERGALDEVMRQIRFANAKISGFVFTFAHDESGDYSKKYRKRYYSGYRHYYNRGYKNYYYSKDYNRDYYRSDASEDK